MVDMVDGFDQHYFYRTRSHHSPYGPFSWCAIVSHTFRRQFATSVGPNGCCVHRLEVPSCLRSSRVNVDSDSRVGHRRRL